MLSPFVNNLIILTLIVIVPHLLISILKFLIIPKKITRQLVPLPDTEFEIKSQKSVMEEIEILFKRRPIKEIQELNIQIESISTSVKQLNEKLEKKIQDFKKPLQLHFRPYRWVRSKKK